MNSWVQLSLSPTRKLAVTISDVLWNDKCFVWHDFKGLSVHMVDLPLLFTRKTTFVISYLLSWMLSPFFCLFVLFGLNVAFKIFQSYRDGVWVWQAAECSIFRVLPHRNITPQTLDMIFLPVTSRPVLIPRSTF